MNNAPRLLFSAHRQPARAVGNCRQPDRQSGLRRRHRRLDDGDGGQRHRDARSLRPACRRRRPCVSSPTPANTDVSVSSSCMPSTTATTSICSRTSTATAGSRLRAINAYSDTACVNGLSARQQRFVSGEPELGYVFDDRCRAAERHAKREGRADGDRGALRILRATRTSITLSSARPAPCRVRQRQPGRTLRAPGTTRRRAGRACSSTFSPDDSNPGEGIAVRRLVHV